MSDSKESLSDRNRRMLVLRGKKNKAGIYPDSFVGAKSGSNNYKTMIEALKKENPSAIDDVDCSKETRKFIKGIS